MSDVAAMEMITLGRTGQRVSRLGLGLAALGRPGYINLGHADDLHRNYDVEAMRSRAEAVLDAGWDLGIRYFDAARSYGRAEDFLGGWLCRRRIDPDDVTVGSKWGYVYTAAWRVDAAQHEVKEHSLANLERQIGESRDLLGSHLDLYQIHSATLQSGVLDDAAVLGRLDRLRSDGVAIGLSLSGPQQAETLRRALAVRVGGAPLFAAVQATWNLLERSAEAALREARDAGLGVIIKEAVANGRLTARNRSAAFAARRRTLDAVASRWSCSVDAVAIAAALAQPWADIVLSGAATVEQLRSNAGALEVKWDDAASDAVASLPEAPDAYWSTRSALPWN